MNQGGKWICKFCYNENFSQRTHCNMRRCGKPREEADSGRSVPEHAPFGHGGGLGYQSQPPSMMGGGLPGGGMGMGGVPNPADPDFLQMLGAAVLASGMSTSMFGLPGPAGGAGLPGVGAPMGFGDSGGLGGGDYGRGGNSLLGKRGYDAGAGMGYGQNKRGGGPVFQNDGSWVCPECRNVNFASRTVCNMRSCKAARPEKSSTPPRSARAPAVPEGDMWKCTECNNMNYPTRSHCNMRRCQKPRYPPSSSDGGKGEKGKEKEKEKEKEKAKDGEEERKTEERSSEQRERDGGEEEGGATEEAQAGEAQERAESGRDWDEVEGAAGGGEESAQ